MADNIGPVCVCKAVALSRMRRKPLVWSRGVTEGVTEVGIGRDQPGSSLGNMRKK